MITKYGFSAVNNRFSSKYGNDFLTNLAQSTNNIITIARVKDILLDDSDKNKFNSLGEWNGLGIIQYESIDKRVQNISGFAKPIDSNIKKYPLVNELVYIILAPNTDLGNNPYSINAYYINTINLWNHPHHNGYPDNSNELPPSQKKDYTQTQAGSVRRVTDNSTEINLGKTFKERANIHPLLPFEGDTILEGRWGNSIRLGSTVNGTPNNWSSTGENGDPITIIRNLDHILLSSAKSINFNALESVNIDTKKFITQADKIFLGKEDLATEPLLLGDTTAQVLRDLTSSIKELATALQFLQSAPVAPNTPAVFPNLLVPATKVLGILDSLNAQLGSSPSNCTITSKRNFTV